MERVKFDFGKNHFELLGLDPAYALDLGLLEKNFRQIQSQVHPDRHVHLSDAERRASMQWSSRANEAYQTLKEPVARANYLLRLRGVEALAEGNTAMPEDFLMEQIEWREAIEESSHAAGALLQLRARLSAEIETMQQNLARLLDVEKDDAGAALLVRKLRFLNKLGEEINDALEHHNV